MILVIGELECRGMWAAGWDEAALVKKVERLHARKLSHYSLWEVPRGSTVDRTGDAIVIPEGEHDLPRRLKEVKR